MKFFHWLTLANQKLDDLTDRAVSSQHRLDYVGSDAKLPSEDGEQLFKLA